MTTWTFHDIPDPTGGTAIVTGAQVEAAARLWDESEKRTGVMFDLEVASGAATRRAS